MQIYLARNQVQAGPYTLTELNNMLATGQVNLSDLMWHAGMQQWQQVGEMTQGKNHYNPNGSISSVPPKRVSVAELYGKKESHSTTSPSGNKPFNINKPVSLKKQTASMAAPTQLASISSRVFAVITDQALALLCIVPLLSGLNYDMDKLLNVFKNPAVFNQLTESVPTHLALMSASLLLALFFVQIFMLIKRGQTIGKLITGVRILDTDSKKLPSVTNIVLMRTVLTNLAYNIPNIGPVILIVDFVMMITNKTHRSLHDKVAKTIVVKADPKQLEK